VEQLTAQALVEFDRWSRRYDRSILQRFLFRPSHRLMVEQLRPTDAIVLDVGCGTGAFAHKLLAENHAKMVYGMDLSPGMLDHAAKRLNGWHGQYELVRGDSEKLPFDDCSIDVVTCSHSFHHYPNQRQVVAEMFRVLKPNGRVILVDGFRDRPYGWLIYDVAVTWTEGEVHHCSAREITQLFRDVGFGNVEQRRREFPIPYLLTIGDADKVDVEQTVLMRLAA